MGNLDLTKVNNVLVEGIDHSDAPDYCDAFIASADYDGKTMSDEQLDEINENGEFVRECLEKQLN